MAETRGNNSRITPELVESIIQQVTCYANEPAAAEAHGISSSTLSSWIRRGEAEERWINGGGAPSELEFPYLQLARGIRVARGVAESANLERIAAAGTWDWKAADRWLKLTNPQRYERGGDREVQSEDLGRLVVAMQEVLAEFVPIERLPEALGVLARRLVQPKAALILEAPPLLEDTG